MNETVTGRVIQVAVLRPYRLLSSNVSATLGLKSSSLDTSSGTASLKRPLLKQDDGFLDLGFLTVFLVLASLVKKLMI